MGHQLADTRGKRERARRVPKEIAAASSKRPRGRPKKSQQNRDVPTALMDAAESLLKEHGLDALVEKRIAALAGVSESMIPYYFGDMNGLKYAVVDRFLSFIDARMRSLMSIDPKSPDAYMCFARTMIEAQYTRPWIARVITVEQQRYSESSIWKWFAQRRGPRGLMQLRDALCRLASIRYGRVVKDETYCVRIALSLFCVTSGTLTMHTLSEPLGVRLADVWDAPWLGHIANIINFHVFLLAGGDCRVLENRAKKKGLKARHA